MKVLTYLLRTTLKNRILSLRKKPALLIVYLICIASFAVVLVAYVFLDNNTDATKKYTDIRILYAFIAGIGLLYTYSFINTGLTTGATLFNMADVGLLFTAPISSRKILVYGLIKQMGTIFLSSIFIVLQIGTLKSTFGLDSVLIINLFVIYAIMIFASQLISMAVYIYSNGNKKRKKQIQLLLYLIFAGIAVALMLEYRHTGDVLDSIMNVVDNRVFGLVPIAGWSTVFFKGSVEQNVMLMITSMALYVFASTILIALFTSGDADYYEDVIKSTEITYNTKQAAKEGKTVASYKKRVKVKLQDVGIGNGKGASIFFYKHLAEMKRTSRFLFIDNYTLVATVGAIIACSLIKESYVNYIIFGVLIYIQFIITVIGRLSTELTKPYIYLIPEKSIKKIFMASLTNMIKPCIDGVIIFTAVCIVSKTLPMVNLFLAIAYASTGVLFVSYTILCQKLLGGQPNKLIQSIVGIGLFILVLSPGIGASVAAITMLPEGISFLGTLPYTVCAIGISALIFAFCGNLIDNAEFTGQ